MSDVLDPCPTCGKRFDFPLTGCMTMVEEFLTKTHRGKCPECGTQIVVDDPTTEFRTGSCIATWDAKSILEIQVVDLKVSVRCRLHLYQAGIRTVGDLLQLTTAEIAARSSELPRSVDEISQLQSNIRRTLASIKAQE